MSVLKKYDFSSVGELDESARLREERNQLNRNQIPIGIKVPLELGEDNDGLLKMFYSMEETASNNFQNMLMTNHGERVGLYDFGANLHELAFELGTERGDEEAIRRIRRTTKKYMPFVELLTFEPLIINEDNEHIGKVGVRVGYKIGAISNKERLVEVIVYSAG